MEDPRAWTKPWTVKQELTRQPEEPNRIYAEPRCLVAIVLAVIAADPLMRSQ